MKFKFDYKNVDPQTVADVLEIFVENYKSVKEIDEAGKEIGHLEFGSINLYLSLKSSVDNSNLTIQDNGKELEWIIKPHKMARTKKEEVFSTKDFVIYKK